MSPGRDARRVGQDWEDRAAAFVEQQGLTILDRGYRCRLGELDIVASDGSCLVVIEVRARRRDRHGTALDSVDASKQKRIVLATRHFLMHHPHWQCQPIRFDVISFDAIESGTPTRRWVRNAFAAA